jgi:hypothetical protein
MKFFTNLPKKTYSTEIGNISLCSFYSFYNKTIKNQRQINVVLDNKTTLVESSISIFGDPDSLWAFLHSNNSINPFKLTDGNATNFISENEIKTSFNSYSTSSGYYASGATFNPPAGSIVTPYVGATSGNPWEYSYVGNFDLNGGLALVEKSKSFGQTVTVKPSVAAGEEFIYPSTAPITSLTFIYKGDTYFPIKNNTTANNSVKYTDSVYEQISIDKTVKVNSPAEATGMAEDGGLFFEQQQNITTTVTVQEYIQNQTKQINVITPIDLVSSLSSLITPKYSGL